MLGNKDSAAPRPGLPHWIAVAVFTACGCDAARTIPGQQRTEPTEVAPLVLSVQVAKAIQEDNVPKTFICYGKLKSPRQSQLGFGRGGKVTEVFKQIGDRFDEGEKLAELDNERLDEQRKTVQDTLDQLKSRQESSPGANTPSLQQQIRQADQQLEQLDLEIANGVIAAPYPSLLLQRQIEVGSSVSPATPAIVVIEDAPPIVEANLRSLAASSVRIGQQIYVKAGSRELVAKLVAKSPAQDATASQKILLEFEDELPENSWSYGQVVEIRVLVQTGDSGYWLPLSALQQQADGLWSCFVAEPAQESGSDEYRVERRLLQIVQLDDDAALVSGSLEDGNLVIVDGTHRVVPGQVVAPQEVDRESQSPKTVNPEE